MPNKSETAFRLHENQYTPEISGHPRIGGLVWFPVKSGRPEFADRLFVTREGFKPSRDAVIGDRNLMIIGEDNKMISQRNMASLALLEFQVYGSSIMCHFRMDQAAPELRNRLQNKGQSSFSFSVQLDTDAEHPVIDTTVHTTTGIKAIVQDDIVNQTLSEILGKKVRLVLQKPDEPRKRKETIPALPGLETILRCADSFPFTALSYTTLDLLNQKLKTDHPDWPTFDPINFRMNFLISGQMNEHALVGKYLKIGDVYFYVYRPKQRCTMPARNQETGGMMGEAQFGSQYQTVLQTMHDELEVPEDWRTTELVRENGPSKTVPTAMLGVDLIPVNEGYVHVDAAIEVVDELPTVYSI